MTLEEFTRLRRERKLVSAEIASNLLDRSVQQIHKLCNQGDLVCFRFGKKFYVYRESIERYFEENTEEYAADYKKVDLSLLRS